MKWTEGRGSRCWHDELDRLTTRVAGGATTGQWTYDTALAGHLGSARVPNGGSPDLYTRSHGYDSIGRETSRTTAISHPTYGTQPFTTSYQYDSYGRLQARVHQQGAFAPVAVGYGYNPSTGR